MKSLLFIAPILALAAACVSPAKVNDEGQAVIAACAAQRESGVYAGYYEAADKCVNPGLRAIFARYDYPYFDLVNLSEAYRLKLARALDNGEISLEDAKLLQAQLGVEMTNEAARRDAMSAQQRAAASQSFANILQGMAAYQAAIAPQSAPLITCTTTTTGGFANTVCY